MAHDLAQALGRSLGRMIAEAEKLRRESGGAVEVIPVRYGRRIDHWRRTNRPGRRNRV